MPTVYKVLAQTGSSGSTGNGSATLAATTNTNLYTVPSTTSTVVSTMTVCNQASTEDINDVFRWMYENLRIWSDTPEGQDRAILKIRTGLVNHAVVADAEINLSATLIELTLLG
jgi:hypothetical protein